MGGNFDRYSLNVSLERTGQEGYRMRLIYENSPDRWNGVFMQKREHIVVNWMHWKRQAVQDMTSDSISVLLPFC